MLKNLLDALALLLVVNWFIPYLTAVLYVLLLSTLWPRLRWRTALKVLAALAALPLLHGVVSVGSLLLMILFSRYTGVIYWAA
jgi:hypothetical protein